MNDCFENEARNFNHLVGSGMIKYAHDEQWRAFEYVIDDDNVTAFLTDDEDGYYTITSQVSGSSQMCLYKRNLTIIDALHNVLYYV